MSKSNVYGIKNRRVNALDRLEKNLEIKEMAQIEVPDPKRDNAITRIKKEIDRLIYKIANFSRKNK